MNCTQGNITIPTLLTDPCNGITSSASCLIDSTLYAELGLESDSTQQQINQAFYLAFLNLKATTENLQEQITDLEARIVILETP